MMDRYKDASHRTGQRRCERRRVGHAGNARKPGDYRWRTHEEQNTAMWKLWWSPPAVVRRRPRGSEKDAVAALEAESVTD